MQQIKIFSPATVSNICCGFDVLGFAIDNFGDELLISKSNKDGVSIKKINGYSVPNDRKKNTASVAGQALLDYLEISQGFEIEINKNIKPGSGIGSSAASAVAAVYGINKLLDNPLKKEELLKFAMQGEFVSGESTTEGELIKGIRVNANVNEYGFEITEEMVQQVEEIIGNYLENTGGAENWENVKGIRMNASINQMGMEIPIEMVQLKDKMYTKISIQGQEIKQGVFDGETLWSTNFMSMKAEKNDQEDVDNIKNELAEFPDPFLNYKEKGFSVLLMGTETVEGSDVFKIKLSKKPMVVDGEEVPNVSIYYFDSENFVPIMVHEEVMSGPGKGMIMESKMSDYQEVEGLYFPFSMTQGVKDQPGQPITIESIELNPSIDDSEFNFPESTEEENN